MDQMDMGAMVPRELLEPGSREELRHVTRDLAAGELDRWLRVVGRQEARCRLVLGRLAAVFLRQQGPHRLGFSRVGDYAVERLGISARELQTAARVVTALTSLPRLAAAFDAGEISWTQLRLLVTVATPATEGDWLTRARGHTVRALEACVREARTANGAFTGGAVTSGLAMAEGGGTRSAGSIRSREAGGAPSATENGPGDADDTLTDGEPCVRFHLRCPRRVRRRWRRAVELARRLLGADGAAWQAAEAIAAEGLAAHGVHGEESDPVSEPAPRQDGTDRDPVPVDRPPVWECLDWAAVRAAIPEAVERLGDGCAELDAFALDARLRQVLRAQRRIDWQLGRLLHSFVRLRLERLLGFSSVAAYARERLGLSPSKVRGLLAVERKTWEVPAFGTAYESGALSWARALALLPVLAERTAAAWTARAQAVTVRRLVAEVDWSLDQLDADPALMLPPGPPRAGHELAADAERQMCARCDWSPIDAEITFGGPASVVALLEAAVAAFRRPGEPRWTGGERLLAHVVGEWEAQPRPRDPIFARDGWRCAVPACSARRNLHDHHLQFRSQGGNNAPENRVAVCVWHHLRGIHAGLVRARGTAPGAIRWELGVRPGRPALLCWVGETYVEGEGGESVEQDAQEGQQEREVRQEKDEKRAAA